MRREEADDGLGKDVLRSASLLFLPPDLSYWLLPFEYLSPRYFLIVLISPLSYFSI